MPLAEAEFDGTVLTCPSHSWTWDLNTGEPIHPKESALAEYPVKVEDGVVYIDTEESHRCLHRRDWGIIEVCAGAT
jgi:toluene monooxygenase system ferredoxin subunit